MTRYIIALLFFHQVCIGQKIQITDAQETVDNVSRAGMYTTINLDAKQVEKAWERHLKTYGKISSNASAYILPSANISEISSAPVSVYSKTQSTPQGLRLWWAIDMGDSYATQSTNFKAYSKAQQVLHDFAALCYRNDISDQIKEAEKAYSASTRAKEKEIRHGDQLQEKIERNKQDKVKLEQQLKQNESDLKQLYTDVEVNKKSQTNADLDVDKMRKAVEVVKAKLQQMQ